MFAMHHQRCVDNRQPLNDHGNILNHITLCNNTALQGLAASLGGRGAKRAQDLT